MPTRNKRKDKNDELKAEKEKREKEEEQIIKEEIEPILSCFFEV